MSFRENRKPLVEKTADLHSKKAFTLVELMIVVGCLMLILVPAWRIFHYGTRSSLQGMLKIDTTLEARRILNQVNLDLKQSCWAWDDENNAYYTISDILSASGRFQNRTISFLVFPSKGSLTDAIPQSLEPDVENPSKVVANRRVSKVSYILQPSPKKEGLPQKFPLFSLIREEKFNPKHPLAQSYPEGLKHKLSDRVCFFRIIPQTIGNADGTQREFFWVALRLIDSTNQAALGAFSRPRQPLKPGKDLATADFFDIVSSKYLDSYRQMGYSNAEMGSQYQRNRFVDPFFPINE